MATVVITTVETLQNGQSTGPVTLAAGNKGRILQLVTTQVGAPASQASLSVKDVNGKQLRKIFCNDGENKKMYLDEIPDGDLTLEADCTLGTCTVAINELDDAADLLT